MFFNQRVCEPKKNNVQISMIILIGMFCINCGRESIIHGGSYNSEDGHSLNTFYLYDFVSIKDIEEHALATIDPHSELTANYYFSHNANIPSHSLQFSADIQEAINTIGQYSTNMKYAFVSDEMGIAKLVNCVDEPNDILCDPRKLGM